jgi:hypothetical protein
MATGLFGYLGYDMARQVEDLPNPPPDTWACPMPFCCAHHHRHFRQCEG